MRGFQPAPYVKSLGYRFPILSTEWDHKKNPGYMVPETVRPYSSAKAWWQANHIHTVSYCRPIRNRVTNIPKVDNKPEHLSGKNKGRNKVKELLAVSNLLLVCPDIAKEWDYEKNYPDRPENYLDRSGAVVWWKCSHGHSWKVKIVNRTTKLSGCPVCYALRKKLHYTHPEIAKTYSTDLNPGVDVQSLSTKSTALVWWHCDECGTNYQMTPRRRTVDGLGCPKCHPYRKPIPYVKSLEYNFPEIAAEWHPTLNGDTKPDQIRSKASIKVWWQCSKHKDHAPWKAYLHLRTNNNTCHCPECRAERKRSADIAS